MAKRKLYHRYKSFGHILFWMASLLLMLFFFYYNEKSVHFDIQILSKAIVSNIGFALSVYINLYVLIPRFLKQKKYIFYVFWLVVLLSSSSLTIQLLLIYPLRNVLNLAYNLRPFNTNLHAAYFFASLIYVAVTTFLKFVKDWFALQDLNYKLIKIEQQKLEAELKILKGQLNPHFLFNSLNNIYSLALIKSDNVPGLILKLSDLMRHIIYEAKENFIPLTKEISFVDNFIALQKIRIPASVKVNYEKKGVVPDVKIIPLLFEPFIDNAFKHGIPNSGEQDFIHILIDFTKPGSLLFTIENNYDDSSEWHNKKDSGIGIQNVKQRLVYLYPKNDYILSVNKKNNIFSVSLYLKLTSDAN